MDVFRIGMVSRIDYETGMIAVAYPDRDNSATQLLPYLQMGGEYHMPQLEQKVAVLHLSTGGEVGVVLGPFWEAAAKPPSSGNDYFRKELSNTPGKAYIEHDAETGELVIRADAIRLQTEGGSVSISDLLQEGGA